MSARRPLVLASTLAALTSLTSLAARPAHADPQRAMDDEMRHYFHGEKLEGPAFFGAGAVSTGFGTYLVTRDDPIARGGGYPMIAFGAIQLLVGAIVFLRTDAQVAALSKRIATDPAAYKRDELKRITGVNREFVGLALVESAFIAGGTAMAVIAAQKQCCKTVQGVGLGIAGEGAAMIMLDLLAFSRALDYTDNLKRFDPGPAPAARAFPVGPARF